MVLDFWDKLLSFMLGVWNNVWPYLIAIFVFIVVIVIHEFGHFLLAKLNGIRVNEFAVGFGPKLFSKVIGETAYSFRLIPFGGFCQMEGEDETSEDPRSFGKAKAWRRLLVVAAGAVFNLILGFVLCITFVASQDSFATTTVGKFDENAVSCNYGLQKYDKIIKANGRNIYTFNDLSYMFGTSQDGIMDFVVERDGQRVELNDVQFAMIEAQDGRNYISLDFYLCGEQRSFLSVIKNAAKTEISLGRVVIMSLGDLITGKFKISDMSGPVGITAAMGDAAKQSLESLIYIAALITVNLGIFNLLPLPALDGGRILFIIVEMLRRKPVPQKYEGWIHAAGFILLMLFAVFIFINDIIKFFV